MRIMSFFLITLPAPLIPAYLIQLRPKYLTQHHFLEHLNLLPRLNVRNKFHICLKESAELKFLGVWA
jgi:hypothetical protein